MGTPLAALCLALLLLWGAGCGQEAAAGDATPAPLLARRIADGAAPLVLDVRTPREFSTGHVPGARNVPVDELAARLGDLGSAREAEVVVYCERGGRAEKALQMLRAAGFRDVRRLEGDMQGWRSDRLPCEGC